MASTSTSDSPTSPPSPPNPNLNIKLEFGGGMELLFANTRSHRISLPPAPSPSSATNITYLIAWMKDNILTERVELFMEGNSVRPGILVLVNDVDWELEGEGEYLLNDGDEIVFISTLHGG